MVKVLFVCLGNICRSPMAEFVMKHLVKQAGLEKQISISSAATSTEAVGCDIHRGTKDKLFEHGIKFEKRRAVQMKKDDYEKYDLIVGMDSSNIRNILAITGGDSEGKVRMLLEYAGEKGAIADPWYTGNFAQTYDDVVRGCRYLLEYIKENML